MKSAARFDSSLIPLLAMAFAIMGLCVPRPVQAQEDPYTLPLRFRVIGNGVTLSKPQVDYDLEAKNDLQLGDQTLSTKTLRFALGKLSGHFPHASLDASEANEIVLVGQWPAVLMGAGEIEFLSRAGQVLGHFDFSEKDLQNWQNDLRSWGASKSSVIGLRDFESKAGKLFEYKSSFRVCAGSSSEISYTRICSPEFEFKKTKSGVAMQPLPALEIPPRVILQQVEAPLKGIVPVDETEPVQFYANLANGWTYEFGAFPPKFEINDLVETKSGDLRLISESVKPSAKVKDIGEKEEGSITRLFRWQQTIGDFRKFWQLDFPKDKPTVYLPGRGGGLFRFDFKIDSIPNESIRPYLYKRSPTGTYVNGPTLEGTKPAGVKLSSKELSVSVSGDGEFDWEAQALKRGEINEADLQVESQGKTYRAYYQLYKGYPREISVRSSGVVGTSGFIINGELAFNYWFEDILGWTNYWLSRQRWGVSAKAFQSLTPVTLSSRKGTLQAATVDLKYRLSPGLWGRDESWGLIAGMNQVSYDVFKATQTGYGFFWARSMPKVFDDLFNIVPFMRYPKWVDLEFLYYPSFQESQAMPLAPPEGNGNWALNFHGKVMWTKEFFGEAGFGIKQYDWNQDLFEEGTEKRLHFSFTSFYGTLGLGYAF